MSIKNSAKNNDRMRLIGIGLILVILICALAALAVYMYAGTGGLGAPNTVSPDTTTTQEQQLAPPKGVDKEIVTKDLTGKWMGHINETAFTVSVENETVTIRMAKAGSSMLYWYGSFQNHAVVGETINSTKLDINKAVLSSAGSKEFTVNDNSLSFDVSAVGQTKTIEVTRASA